MGFWGGVVVGIVATAAIVAAVTYGYSAWLMFRGLR